MFLMIYNDLYKQKEKRMYNALAKLTMAYSNSAYFSSLVCRTNAGDAAVLWSIGTLEAMLAQCRWSNLEHLSLSFSPTSKELSVILDLYRD